MPPETATKEDLLEIGRRVTELREEVEKKSVDPEKVRRLNAFLDESEEKINQPLTRAIAEQKQAQEDIAEFKEKLEAAGVTEVETKARMDVLENELARRGAAGAADPDVYRESPEYKALNEYCRIGDVRLSDEQKALLRTDIAPDGGFLVTTEMDTEITKKITEVDPIRSVARVRTTGAKSLDLPIRNTIPVATYEGEADEGADSASNYENVNVVPFRQTFTSPITRDMLQDAAFNMEAEIMGDAGEAFGFGEGNGFVVGTGFKQPAGFTVNAILRAATRVTAATGVLDPEAIILLTGDLKVGYNPVYVMNRRTLALIRTFRADAVSAGDAASGFLWQPGMNGPVSNTINGFPYILANSMPDVADGAHGVMAFGDFRRGYTIVDRTGMSVIRDEFTLKKKAIVEFTMNRWNTGQVTLPEAIKLLQVKA